MPVVLVLVPLVVIIYFTSYYIPRKSLRLASYLSCFKRTLTYIFFILIVTPIALALGMALVAVAIALAIVPLYVISFGFLIRIGIATCKTKL